MEITTRADFGKLAQKFLKHGIGAEIGVERGNFSKLILDSYKGNLFSVDMWANEEIYNTALETLKTTISSGRSMIMKMPSLDAANDFEDESLDFVYIDADHDYAAVKADLEAWFPKIRHGGLVAGHDYLNWTRDQGAACDFGVKAAVDEFCVKHGYTLKVTTEDFWDGNPYPTWYFVKQIPKIIYYTWINPQPLPERFQKYIDGWKVLMPDYDIRQISLENITHTPFVDEAIRRGKYAVAGHYARCERLYATGGIYFDIDVEAVKRFDGFLGFDFFAGSETDTRVNNAVFGSKPGHEFIKKALEFMDAFDFDNPGRYGVEIETGPEMFTTIAKSFGWKEKNILQYLPNTDAMIVASRVFYPYYFDVKYHPGCVERDTFAVHHWAKTW